MTCHNKDLSQKTRSGFAGSLDYAKGTGIFEGEAEVLNDDNALRVRPRNAQKPDHLAMAAIHDVMLMPDMCESKFCIIG